MKRLKRETSSALLAVPAGAALATAALALLRRHKTSIKFERFGAAAMETLLNAIDANDPVTGAHVRRVARYALVLADAMGTDAHTCHVIERVALFHDIGKIHEALFDVIHDDGKLDPPERKAIRTHPARGAKVLAPLAAFYPDLSKGRDKTPQAERVPSHRVPDACESLCARADPASRRRESRRRAPRESCRCRGTVRRVRSRDRYERRCPSRLPERAHTSRPAGHARQ